MAQSKVKRLISHKMTSTGIGASTISVLLRNGNASIVSEVCMHESQQLTVVAQECDHKVVAKCKQVHRVAKEVGDHVVASDYWYEQKLQDIQKHPDWEESSDRDLRQSAMSG